MDGRSPANPRWHPAVGAKRPAVGAADAPPAKRVSAAEPSVASEVFAAGMRADAIMERSDAAHDAEFESAARRWGSEGLWDPGETKSQLRALFLEDNVPEIKPPPDPDVPPATWTTKVRRLPGVQPAAGPGGGVPVGLRPSDVALAGPRRAYPPSPESLRGRALRAVYPRATEVRNLGSGTYATVFEVKTNEEGSVGPVAVRVEALPTTAQRERAQATANLAALLGAEGVGPTVYDYREERTADGTFGVLTMEHFEDTLWGVRKRLSEKDRRLAAAATRALVRRMHALGWSHGDLKPANIVVRLSRHDNALEALRLIDFGQAQRGGLSEVIERPHTCARYYGGLNTPQNMLCPKPAPAVRKALKEHVLLAREREARHGPRGRDNLDSGYVDDWIMMRNLRALLGVPLDPSQFEDEEEPFKGSGVANLDADEVEAVARGIIGRP